MLEIIFRRPKFPPYFGGALRVKKLNGRDSSVVRRNPRLDDVCQAHDGLVGVILSSHLLSNFTCYSLKPSRSGQNCHHIADDIFKLVYLAFVPKGSFQNNLALVQIMAWRRSGDMPSSEPMRGIVY